MLNMLDARSDDVLEERFFSQPPPAWEIEPDDNWQPEPMSTLERLAMMATVAPAMAICAVAITLLLLSGPSIEPSITLSAASSASPSPVVAPPVEALAVSAPAPSGAAVAEVVAPEVPPPPLAVAERSAPPSAQRSAGTRAVKSRGRHSSELKRARKLLDAGDATGARDIARDAVRLAPEQAAAYIVLAGAFDKLGDRASMRATFRTCAALATDPLASACKALAR